MEQEEIRRLISGLAKKHGDGFELQASYITDNDKIRKRRGRFLELTADLLILVNDKKGGLVRLALDRILDLKRAG